MQRSQRSLHHRRTDCRYAGGSGAEAHELRKSDPDCGFSFEGFVIEEILKGLQDVRVQTQAYYYRTHSGAEIDLVLEGKFGILPIEIKYGSTILSRQLRSMTEFIQEHRLPFGVLINQADRIEWLTKNIIQIPAGYL